MKFIKSKGFLNVLLLIIGIMTTRFAMAEDLRTFRSKDGRELKAKILNCLPGKVHLEYEDGRRVLLEFNRFSDEDVSYMTQWAEEHKDIVPQHLKDVIPRVDISVTTGKTNKADDHDSGYVDERKQRMKFEISLKNMDAAYPIPDAKVTLLVLGKSPETGADVVVFKQEFTKTRLPFSQLVELKAKPFELWYDDYGAMYGYKYKGYLVYVEEPTGKLFACKMIPQTAIKYIDNIKRLKAGDSYNKEYRASGTVSLYGVK